MPDNSMEELPVQQNSENPRRKFLLIVFAILIGAWIIGMSIIVAGWLITRQLAQNNAPAPEVLSVPIDIQVPAGVPVLGNNHAPVTIVEFADFQCPYCGQWHNTILPKLRSDYIDKGLARFVYMDFAFLGEESVKAAEAARCAADQGKFWEFHDALFTSQQGENNGGFSDANLKQFAQTVQLNTNTFNSCFDARLHKGIVEADLAQGEQYGVTSTPTVFINGVAFEGVQPWENYKAAIEKILNDE